VTSAKATAAAIIRAAQIKADSEAKEAVEEKEAKETQYPTTVLEATSEELEMGSDMEAPLAKHTDTKKAEVKRLLASADAEFAGKKAAEEAVDHLLAAADSALAGKSASDEPQAEAEAVPKPVKPDKAVKAVKADKADVTTAQKPSRPEKQHNQKKPQAAMVQKKEEEKPKTTVVDHSAVEHASAAMVDPLSKHEESEDNSVHSHSDGWFHRGATPQQVAMNADLARWGKMLDKNPPETQLYDPTLLTPLEEMSDDGMAEMATMSAGVGASTGLYVLLGDLWRSNVPNHAGSALPLTKDLSCDGCMIVLEHGCNLHGHFPACASNVQVRRVMKGCAEKGLRTRGAHAKNVAVRPFTCPAVNSAQNTVSKVAVNQIMAAWKKLPATQRTNTKAVDQFVASAVAP
jgi:hypothetical protein